MNGRAFDALGIKSEGKVKRQDAATEQQSATSEEEESMDDSDRMEWRGRRACTKYRVREKALYWVTGASGVAFCSEGMAR